jgi:hypothetical protein
MPLLASEAFDNVENTELVNETGSLGTVKATGKTGVTYKIENDENGGKYLSVSIAAESAIDPHLSVTTSTPITEFYGSAKAMTVSASLSLPEGERAASCSYRIRSRVDNQKLDLYIFSVNKNGEVWLGTSESGVKLATLASDTLTDISVTVSWDNATITGYVGGEYVGQIALNTETRGLDWLAGATNLMYFYFSDNDGGLIIDNFMIYADEFNPEI